MDLRSSNREPNLEIYHQEISRLLNLYDGTPLLVAIFSKNKAQVQQLIRGGVDVNAKSQNGATPLHLVVELGNLDFLRILLAAGANPNAKTDWGETPLHKMSRLDKHKRGKIPFVPLTMPNDVEIARVLLNAGANINAVDFLGDTPLHKIAIHGDVEIARFLFRAGANIYSTNKGGKTPLHKSAEWANCKVARFLVGVGADINATDNEGETPFHTVAHHSYTEFAGYMLKALPAIDDANIPEETLWDRMYRNRMEFIRFLADAGADIEARNQRGETPFFMAAMKNDLKIAQTLVDVGADINAGDKKGQTPFHIAAKKSFEEFGRFLVDAGADMNSNDKDGRKPLHYAALKNNLEFARFMVDAGAEIHPTDNHTSTPFHLAVHLYANFKFACFLLDASVDFSRKDFFQNINSMMYSFAGLMYGIKMKCLGLHFSELRKHMWNLKLEYKNELREFEKRCEAEVARMRRQELREGYRFNLCDVLTKSENVLRRILHVEEVRWKLEQVVREKSFPKSYPVYGEMISIKFKRAVMNVECSAKSRKIIAYIVNSGRRIPEECVKMIASYFTVKDMRDLVDSFK